MPLIHALKVNPDALHNALQAQRLFNQQHHAQRRDHHNRRQRRNRRIKMILDIAHNLNRQHVDARAGQESGKRYVVERIDNRHDAGGSNAGFDVRQYDAEERVLPPRLHAASSIAKSKFARLDVTTRMIYGIDSSV